MTLTARQRAIVRFLARRHPTIPSYAEIGTAVGLSSLSSVAHQTKALAKAQVLRPRDDTIQMAAVLAPDVVLVGDGIFRVIPVLPCGRCELSLPVSHHCETDLKTSLEWTPTTPET